MGHTKWPGGGVSSKGVAVVKGEVLTREDLESGVPDSRLRTWGGPVLLTCDESFHRTRILTWARVLTVAAHTGML